MSEETKTAKPTEKTSGKKIAVIRIRGSIGTKQPVKDTFKMMRLYRKNYCVVVEETASNKGMINKIKDYVTWGYIDDETLKVLKEKRGEKTKTKEGKEVEKPFFRLLPPIGVFERKGIKMPFSLGGVLGNRKEKINDIIKRMI